MSNTSRLPPLSSSLPSPQRKKQEPPPPLLSPSNQESLGGCCKNFFGGMDEASASSLVRKAYRLPSTVPMAETFPRSLPRQWLDFRRSGPPLKIGVISDGQGFRHGKPGAPTPDISEAFAAGTPVVDRRVVSSGQRVLFDFPRKVMVYLDDEGTPTHTVALYWIDDEGYLFSPALFGDIDEDGVRRVFDGSSHGTLTITAVRRCRHREARTFGFLEKMGLGAAWIFGWYGAAAADVEQGADGGDLRPNWTLLGADRAHGRGLHVSAQQRVIQSALLSSRRMDARQTTHLLFCALALGWREIIPAGSPQSQPSSTLFQTGTDAMADPAWHVFWKSSAGARVLPLFMVSFRLTQDHKRRGTPLEKASVHNKALRE